MLRILGLDIGTSTLSAVVTDEKGNILASKTIDNKSQIEGTKRQNPNVIINDILDLKDELTKEFAPISAIGVTGQMHGIVYIDKVGEAVSDLYTWQDESGNKPYKNVTYASYLTAKTGFHMASGFGFTTHFVNITEGNVPQNAVTLCTIHDYLVMKLTGRKTPLMHTSDAASLGCFDNKNLCFDKNALAQIGIEKDFLPEVTKACAIAGFCDEIPVSVAIGDNQASVLGSVSDEKTLLINIGTGSQVSVIVNEPICPVGGEARPLNEDKYILVGAPLCGGRSFALLHSFFTHCCEIFGGNKEDVYKNMDKIAQLEPQKHSLNVDTRFCGTRTNPDLRGSITNISDTDFTPAELTRGFLFGMASELYELFKSFYKSDCTKIVASGNAVRKSTVLRGYLTELFGMEIITPAHKEEAAFGACVFAATASKTYPDTFTAAKEMIHYKEV